MLVWLHQVEVATITLREPIMSIELELGKRHGVGSVLEGHWQVHVVSTTSSHTGHATGIDIGVVHQGSGGGESTGGHIGHIISIRVVEPLLTPVVTGTGVGNVVINLGDPHKLLHGVVKVQLNLVAHAVGALVTGELQLLNQVLVRDLSKSATLISVQEDVVNEQRGGAQRAGHNGALAWGVGARVVNVGSIVAIGSITELKVHLHLMVLQSNQRQGKTRVAVEPEFKGNVQDL